MDIWDDRLKSFMEDKECMPKYALVSPAFYEELKSYLGIEFGGHIHSYHGIVIYISSIPDVRSDLIFSGCD